jgi:Na+-translocating ferredoxin:NAD+ oxidoreductase RNF subunit RnfB
MEKKDIIRQIYKVLPQANCGFCRFGNCGQFARAVAEGRASPFGCQQNPWSGYRISQIIGVKVPAYSYQFQPASVRKAGMCPRPKALREELRGLSQTTDDILARLAKLKEGTLARET